MDWTGKRVLVTGAGGFIGSHLTEALVQGGAEVRALVHYNALGTAGWLDESPVAGELEIVRGDVCDAEFVDGAVADREVVFHLAALIGIPYSYRAPRSYLSVNVGGTLNVLQAARRHGTARVVQTSTSEVYGTARTVPIDESHPLQAQSPYAASKIGADKLAESFHLSFGVPVVIVRPFNTFGPRQSTRAVIPTIITQALADGPCVTLGALRPTRDMNFVSNTVAGFLAAAAAEDVAGEVFNIGSGREVAIGELARLILEILGIEKPICQADERMRPQGSEVERLLAAASKAHARLSWSPTVSLEEGLRRTVEWFQHVRGTCETAEYTV